MARILMLKSSSHEIKAQTTYSYLSRVITEIVSVLHRCRLLLIICSGKRKITNILKTLAGLKERIEKILFTSSILLRLKAKDKMVQSLPPTAGKQPESQRPHFHLGSTTN